MTLMSPAPMDLQTPEQSPIEPPPAIARPRPPRWPWRRGASFLTNVLATLIVIALIGCAGYRLFQFGLEVRDGIWRGTYPIRFDGDAAGGFGAGRHMLTWWTEQLHQNDKKELPPPWKLSVRQVIEGESHFYDHLVDEHGDDGNYGMDYPPGRLLLMALWFRQLNLDREAAHLPHAWEWEHDSPDMASWIRGCNTAAAGAAAVLMFFLVWHWMRRDARRLWAAGAPHKPWWPMNGLLVAAVAGYGLVYSIWACWQIGGVPDWYDYAAMALLLMALVAALRELPAAHRAWTCALLAAAMVWLDPADLAVSHIWPQWDVWPVPFFIGAALLASLDWQFSAAAALVIGSMFKGQLLILTPVFPLWLVFGGRIGALCRFVTGFAFTSAVIFAPWLVRGPVSLPWIRYVMVAAMLSCALVALRPYVFRRANLGHVKRFARRTPTLLKWRTVPQPRSIILAAIAGAIVGIALLIPALLLRPIGQIDPHFTWLLALFVIALPWFLPRRALAHWLAATLALVIWLSGVLLGGSFSWYWVGFDYGTHRQDRMQMGLYSFSNLPAILHQHYGWDLHDILFTLHIPGGASYPLEVKTALALIYLATLVLCGIGAAIQSRRDDPRTLSALAAAALLFPCILAQTSERYLVMASAISCSLIAISVGLTLLHVLIALLGVAMLLHQEITNANNDQFAPAFVDFWSRTYPNIAWLMMMMAAIMLAQSLIPSRGRRKLRRVIQEAA